MKIRNKKTGEIRDISIDGMFAVKSLADLTKEWEDVAKEDPKDYWYINALGDVIRAIYTSDDFSRDLIVIGNYFETPEEAELAVRKLEAWKRLKDAGFEFKGWKVLAHDSPRINFNVHRKNNHDIVPFLDLLFGDEG